MRILECLDKLLEIYSDSSLIKECMWAVANISAGSVEHVRTIMMNPIINKILDFLSHPHQPIKKEVLWIIGNMTSDCIFDITQFFVERGIIEKLCTILQQECDSKSVSIGCIEAIKNIIISGKCISNQGEPNPFKAEFEAFGGVDIVNKLLNHQCPDVSSLAEKFLQYFYNYDKGGNGGKL